MLSNFLFGTIYSTGLASYCYSVFPPEKQWGLKQSLALIGFWNIFMVPTGKLWNNINEIILKKLGFQSQMIRRAFVNKKYMLVDLFLNHTVYQIIFVSSLYGYFNYFFPNNMRFSIFVNENNKEKVFNEAIGEIIWFRIKLSLFSSICDVWLSQKEDFKMMKMIKTKNLGVQIIWHLYILNKFFGGDEKIKDH